MKKIFVLGIMLLLVSVSAVVYAGASNGKAQHLYLYEKSGDPNWDIVDGAWGKMMYKENTFVFNGHGLDSGEDYTLISYAEGWPGAGSACWGDAVANKGGNVHIAGVPNLVINDYWGYTGGGDYLDEKGAKIWLVLSSDVDCTDPNNAVMTGWHFTEYLFENDLIN